MQTIACQMKQTQRKCHAGGVRRFKSVRFLPRSRSALLLILALFGASPAGEVCAQQPGRSYEFSPRVNADRTVTFSLKAPNATKVDVVTQFTQGPQPLTVGADGAWSVTLGPAEPDLYPYNFVVDGVPVADPNNPNLFPNERFKSSLVDVPATEPLIHSAKEVPHGEVSACFYESKTLHCTRPLLVYTPPGYRVGNEHYPVLYLVSGMTDTEETWFKVGRVNFVLDNLIAEKKAVPMIVAMPYGNMMSGTPMPSSPEAAKMYQVFSDELTVNVMPFVEGRYRVAADREKRAIAGFSRGGGQSLYSGFNNLDKFAWIGSYAAYLTPEVFEKHFAAIASDPGPTNSQIKLLWMGVGRSDFLYKPTVDFEAYLTSKGIRHEHVFTEGGHTWMNARRYLTETLQKFFK